MGSERSGNVLRHGLEVLYAVVVLAYYALPFLESKPWLPSWVPSWVTTGLVNFLRMPAAVPTPASGGTAGGAAGYTAAAAVGFVAYVLPCIHLSKLVAPFLSRKRPGFFDPLRIFPLTLDIVASTFALILFALHVLRYAQDAQ